MGQIWNEEPGGAEEYDKPSEEEAEDEEKEDGSGGGKSNENLGFCFR